MRSNGDLGLIIIRRRIKLDVTMWSTNFSLWLHHKVHKPMKRKCSPYSLSVLYHRSNLCRYRICCDLCLHVNLGSLWDLLLCSALGSSALQTFCLLLHAHVPRFRSEHLDFLHRAAECSFLTSSMKMTFWHTEMTKIRSSAHVYSKMCMPHATCYIA